MTVASRTVSRLPARPAAANSRASLRPKSLDELISWLREQWAEEPFPDRIHIRAIEDGSRLGAHAFSGAFLQHVDKPRRTDEDGLYVAPLNAALARMRDGSQKRLPMPISAENIWSLIRVEFDWRRLANSLGWPEELYALALAGALMELWDLFDIRGCAKTQAD